MAENINGHTPHPEGVVCGMSEKVDLLHDKFSYIENQQILLNEKVDLKFDILTDFFKESLDRQDKSIDRIALSVEETRRSNDLLAKDIELRFSLQKQQEEHNKVIANKDSEIKKLTTAQKFIVLWADPLGKVFVTVFTALGLTCVYWIASKWGVPVESIIK